VGYMTKRAGFDSHWRQKFFVHCVESVSGARLASDAIGNEGKTSGA
jgi:hypothetical protein